MIRQPHFLCKTVRIPSQTASKIVKRSQPKLRALIRLSVGISSNSPQQSLKDFRGTRIEVRIVTISSSDSSEPSDDVTMKGHNEPGRPRTKYIERLRPNAVLGCAMVLDTVSPTEKLHLHLGGGKGFKVGNVDLFDRTLVTHERCERIPVERGIGDDESPAPKDEQHESRCSNDNQNQILIHNTSPWLGCLDRTYHRLQKGSNIVPDGQLVG